MPSQANKYANMPSQLNIAQMSLECSIEKLERNIRSDKSTQEICQYTKPNLELICHFLYIPIYIYLSLPIYSYIYIYIYIYYTINVVPGFRSDSSLYCYRPVSYGQEMTTLIRQYERMTINFNCWLYNTNSKVQNK